MFHCLKFKRKNLLWILVAVCIGGSLMAMRFAQVIYVQHENIKGFWKQQIFTAESSKVNKVYNITWYSTPYFFLRHGAARDCGLEDCKFSNCRLLFGKLHTNISDAVIFDGRIVQPKDFFPRKPGQVWIFSAHEAPISYGDVGGHWTNTNWTSSFNWTMTYDETNTDIYLPYGEIREKPKNLTDERDYKRLFRQKNKTGLIVHSHCQTRAKRQEYLQKLERLNVTVDSLGACGKPMMCGHRYDHNFCFDIIDKYKFYFAFENAICDKYFTEKVFKNYNFDSIMVLRGGRNKDAQKIFPNGTYISTDDFNSVQELADYLNKVSSSETLYTEMLRKKNRYYSVTFRAIFKRAMCDVCERMNKQDLYRKQVMNLKDWAFRKNPCVSPKDIADLV